MLEWMQILLDKFLDTLVHIFPVSPFRGFIQELNNLPFLGYLNWFVPVGKMIEIGVLWLGAIAAFYAYSLIARWIKMIE